MLISSYLSVLIYVLVAQKNRLGSFEYPQHMFWLRNKKLFFSYTLLSGRLKLIFYYVRIQIIHIMCLSLTREKVKKIPLLGLMDVGYYFCTCICFSKMLEKYCTKCLTKMTLYVTPLILPFSSSMESKFSPTLVLA